MKKMNLILVCLVMTGAMSAQEKYPIPACTANQKHERTLYLLFRAYASEVNYAKSFGVTPYEYGRRCGELSALTWGPGNDFEGYVKGGIYNLENLRHISDPPLTVKENQDGSVSIITPDNMWHKYYADGDAAINYKEFKEFWKGLMEPIASHMGAVITMESQDSLLVFKLARK